MEVIYSMLGQLSSFIWGPVMLVMLLGVGVYLTLGLKLIPWRKVGLGFSLLVSGKADKDQGEISPFQALMTALSATIGTGNIAGHSHFPRRTRGDLLDVDHGTVRHGNQVRRSRAGCQIQGSG